ncbi:MAG: glycerophosphodiester phosphodiesterase family protein [Lachnospiraceae bacterium]
MKDTDLITNIELKNSVFYYRGLEEKVLALVDQYRLRGRILFSSFSHVSVLKCKQLAPEIPAGFLQEDPFDNAGCYAKDHQVECYHPGKKILSKEQVKECHAQGIQVNVWTINKKKDIRKMVKWKVDGIITNYPDRVRKEISE